MALDVVTSPANPLFKEIRKAQEAGGLTSHGWLIAEGPHLVEEAMRSGLHIRRAIVGNGAAPFHGRADRILEVTEKVFRSISGTGTPQGILVLADPPAHTAEDLVRAPAMIVILDGIQDPGNAGAIARSAEAFGATGLVFAGPSANPLSPKTLRASAGSLFRIPFIRGPITEAIPPDIPLFAGIPGPASAPWECDFTQPCAIVIGSEGAGVSSDLLRRARKIHIPTRGVESLNAAVSAGVLLYEASRQRSRRA
jgi:TrmH family RNA methyltransferase